MDPEVCDRLIDECLDDCDYVEALAACHDLLAWYAACGIVMPLPLRESVHVRFAQALDAIAAADLMAAATTEQPS